MGLIDDDEVPVHSSYLPSTFGRPRGPGLTRDDRIFLKPRVASSVVVQIVDGLSVVEREDLVELGLEFELPLSHEAGGNQNENAGSLLLVSSAGLLIVVGVVRDTFFNIEAELKLHGYDDQLLVR